VLLFVIFLRPLLSIVTHFPAEGHSLLFLLLLEISPLIALLILSSILAGVLNTYFYFWLPAISPGLRAIICIGFIFIAKDKLGIHAVTLGYIFGELARLFVFIFFLAKKKILRLKINLQFDSELKEFLKALSFLVISSLVIGLNPIID